MESSPARPQNMIDTTDALEAVSACQTMKNFLFTLILIGLVLCQIIFWMDHFGLVSKEACSACKSAGPACPSQAADQCSLKTCPEDQPQTNAQGSGPILLAAVTGSLQQAEPVAADPEQPQSIEQAVEEIVKTANQRQPDAEVLLEKETDLIPAEMRDKSEPVEPVQPESAQEPTEETDVVPVKKELFHISCRFANIVVSICNYIILTAAILYSLSLLICLKISLTGRLGGMNHITRAFFVSLFLVVVLIPWQTILPGVLIGAVWLPSALWSECWANVDSSFFWKILFYLRFTGFCVVAVFLLLWAQMRSAKWARATLRRLGVVR